MGRGNANRSSATSSNGGHCVSELGKDEKAQRVLFVLGSGASLESGAPCVGEVTRQILEADEEALPSWFQGVEGGAEVRDIQAFLKLLIYEFERSGEVANYEDLFSMCQKIYEHEVGMTVDGSIIRFRDHIYRESAAYWRRYTDGAYLGNEPLGALADRATFLITDCIKSILGNFQRPQGLDLISEFSNKLGVDAVDILTLNHDKLVEIQLGSKGIPYTCGFDLVSQRGGDVDFFDEAAFEASEKVRIIKLHGSCDWIRLGRHIDEDTTLWRWGIPNENAKDWNDFKDFNGERLIDNPFEKATLTGSTTKSAAYTRGIFGDLYLAARNILNQHDTIICSGYGWRDEGFNWMLKEWAENDLDRKVLLLHDREQNAFEDKKPWPWPDGWKWNSPKGWLKWHPQWLSATDYNDIREQLGIDRF